MVAFYGSTVTTIILCLVGLTVSSIALVCLVLAATTSVITLAICISVETRTRGCRYQYQP
jgi:hypothetical protein